METTRDTLASGLRIVHRRCDSPVEYFGVAIDAGSRDEAPGSEGLAHFVEHTIFKGTRRRRSWHVINRMESVGGELNAYTTKEETLIYSTFPSGNLQRASELIADLVTGSVFPAAELDLEREVILDEINSYLDTPSENVFDEFDDLHFRGSSLGHNILGTPETVKSFTTADCLRWIETNYTASRMVVFYMGSAPVGRVRSLIERHFGGIAPSSEPFIRTAPEPHEPFEETRHTGCHQSHTVMGATLPGVYSPLRLPISLLNNVLGGPGMNSWLNFQLRERRGLVYSVDSSTALYTDTGLLTIYFGCDAADSRRCSRLACDTLARIARMKITPRQLEAAKRQYAGQLIVSSENREQLALSTARAVLRNLQVKTLPEIIESVTSLSTDTIAEAATLFDPARFSRLTIE